MTTSIAPMVRQQFIFGGVPASGGLLFTYAAGTVNKLATYTDFSGNTANTNPIQLDTQGQADVWLTPNLRYKFVVCPATDTDPPTNPFWTRDNIAATQDSSLQLADYAALRAYTGSQTALEITGYLVNTCTERQPLASFTRDDTDTTSADNGGTIIVDGANRRWKRILRWASQPEVVRGEVRRCDRRHGCLPRCSCRRHSAPAHPRWCLHHQPVPQPQVHDNDRRRDGDASCRYVPVGAAVRQRNRRDLPSPLRHQCRFDWAGSSHRRIHHGRRRFDHPAPSHPPR
jgi:hypothetical protein